MRDSAPNLTIIDPRIGDKVDCPGCGEVLTLDWADGWRNDNGLTCYPANTTHSDHVKTEMTGGTE